MPERSRYAGLEISRAAKCLNEAGQERLREGYGKLLALARGVVRQAGDVLTDLREGRLPIVGSMLRVLVQESQLKHFLPLVQRVIVQAKERVWQGNRHVVGKVLSLYEAPAQAGKPSGKGRPTSRRSLGGCCVSTKWKMAWSAIMRSWKATRQTATRGSRPWRDIWRRSAGLRKWPPLRKLHGIFDRPGFLFR